jgi:hypothetical protein
MGGRDDESYYAEEAARDAFIEDAIHGISLDNTKLSWLQRRRNFGTLPQLRSAGEGNIGLQLLSTSTSFGRHCNRSAG